MTIIGLLCILAMAGVMVYAGIRLAPVYLNYLKVAQILERRRRRSERRQPRPNGMMRPSRQLEIQDPIPDSKDIEITKDEGGMQMHVAYDHSAPYVANVSLTRALRQDREGAVICASRTSLRPGRGTFGHIFRRPSFAGRPDASKRRRESQRALGILGDSVLNCTVARLLYDAHPQADEGDLSRLRASLVSGESLALIAAELGMGEYLGLGAGELKSGGFSRASILADALEAMLGAIFLDGGYEAAAGAVADSSPRSCRSSRLRAH